jgi:O-antigen/teichoic acid export membrane protein
MGESMNPLRSLAWGMLLVMVDVRFDGVDILPDPLGWVIAGVAASTLARAHPAGRSAFTVATAAAVAGLLPSLPDWVGSDHPVIELVIAVAMFVVVFATCTALMVVVPQRRDSANKIRWWTLWIDLSAFVLIALAAEREDIAGLVVLAAVGALVIAVWFFVLLFGCARLLDDPHVGAPH